MGLKQGFIRINARVIKRVLEGEVDNLIIRQRFYVFTYSSLGIVLGILLNLLGVAGPQGAFFFYANSINVLAVILLSWLVIRRTIKVHSALTFIALITQLEISGELLYLAFQNTPYSINLIVGNMTLSAFLLLLTITAYMRYLPFILAAISTGMYAVCTLITGNDSLSNFFLLYLVVFFLMGFLGVQLVGQMHLLQGENVGLKYEQKRISTLFGIREEQLNAYIEMAKAKDLSPGETNDLLSVIGEKAKGNILANVAYLLEQRQIQFNDLGRLFPMLSPSELEICHLILRGKKLAEISKLLGKSQSNISCQRSNIRTKLKLTKEDDLRTKLLEISRL